MTYLQPRDKGDYRCFSGELGKVLEVSIAYELGGANWFHGGVNPRGIYIHLTPVERTEHSTCYTIGGGDSGAKCLVRELKKKSQKTLDLIAKDLDAQVGAIIGLWEAGNRQAAWALVMDIKSKWLVVAESAAA
jgi:hypothetical protein